VISFIPVILPAVKNPYVPIEQEAAEAPELVRMLWSRGKSYPCQEWNHPLYIQPTAAIPTAFSHLPEGHVLQKFCNCFF
jgi:hypothetical protein